MSDLSLSTPAAPPAFRFNLGETLKHAVLILGALVVLPPFYAMLSYSLKAPAELM